jgi:hypothetical protein
MFHLAGNFAKQIGRYPSQVIILYLKMADVTLPSLNVCIDVSTSTRWESNGTLHSRDRQLSSNQRNNMWPAKSMPTLMDGKLTFHLQEGIMIGTSKDSRFLEKSDICLVRANEYDSEVRTC